MAQAALSLELHSDDLSGVSPALGNVHGVLFRVVLEAH